MILLSATQSVRDSFKLDAVSTTPVVPTNEWHRFWRVDSRKIRTLGEVVLFTNHDTLFSFVADAQAILRSTDLRIYFLRRLTNALASSSSCGVTSQEEVIIHRAIDRSVQSVMNSFLLKIESIANRGDARAWEKCINQAPVISRDFRFPSELLRARLEESA